MMPQDLIAELKRQPFQPFRIVTTDTKGYDVTERDVPMLWVGRNCVLIGFRAHEDDPLFDRYEVVALEHVVRLEPLPKAHKQAS